MVAAGVSAREAEVLALLADHLTHAEIAQRLHISIRTVESHVGSLRRKLDMPGHRDLVRYAVAQRDAGRGGPPLPPAPLTSFVGRQRERAELAEALLAARVVTVVGPGGAGKTRLARAVAEDLADRFPGGVWFADLVPVSDGAALPTAVAAACGVEDLPGRDTVAALVRGLGTAASLLVLDNCEHLLDPVAGLVERLVGVCGPLRMLLTSRGRLALAIERVYRLGGLSPQDDAPALFLERARGAGWAAPTPAERVRIAAVCRSLDGLALAIELAAVRLPALGLDGVERALARQGDLLTGGPRAGRHRSLRDALDWSWRLLGTQDRAVLCRVSVFPAAFDTGSALAVAGYGHCPPDAVPGALARLVEQSLLAPADSAGSGRWRVLEPIRQYALARMGPEDAAAHPAHLAWARGEVAALLPASARLGRGWYGGFDLVSDDVRAALAWAAAQPGRVQEAAELAGTLALLLFRAGRAREAQHRYTQAGELAGEPAAAANAFAQAAAVAKCRVAGDDALRLEYRAVEALRAGGEPTALASALVRASETIVRFEGMFRERVPVAEADALLAEAGSLAGGSAPVAIAARVVAAGRGDPADPRCRAEAAEAAAAARDLGDPVRASAALDSLTGMAIMAGTPVAAAGTARRRVDLLDGAPVEPAHALELKDALHMAVLACVGAGDLRAAREYGRRQRSLAYLREQRDLALEATLLPDALAGDADTAVPAGRLFLEDWLAAGRPAAPGRAIGPCALAMLYGLLGQDAARRRWLEVVAELRGVGPHAATRGSGYGELFDAVVLLHAARPDEAYPLLAAASSGWYANLFCTWRAALLAEAAVLAGRPDAAEHVARAEGASAGNPVGEALARRAAALAGGEQAALVPLAAALAEAGAPYQAARTLALAGRTAG